MSKSNILLHLSLIDGIGPATAEKIISKFQDLPKLPFDQLYLMSKKDLINYFGLTELVAEKTYKGLSDKSILEKELNLIKKNNIRLITLLDQDYPELLKNIYLAPLVLYVAGKVDWNNAISIVGARKATSYGKRVIDNIVPELVLNGWQIVSGGALGIDAFAHSAAIKNFGRTTVVLGSGLLNPYPALNKKLFQKIVSEDFGAVISPFPLNMAPLKGNFPARNRIIAGLSNLCLVVQAAKRSGALITAQFALDQSREVCAIPGPIDDHLSQGCNNLISQGAHLVASAEDILNVLGCSYKSSNQEKGVFKEPKTLGEKIIYHCSNSISFDELQIKLNLSSGELNSKLMDLQLSGKITQDFTGRWSQI